MSYGVVQSQLSDQLSEATLKATRNVRNNARAAISALKPMGDILQAIVLENGDVECTGDAADILRRLLSFLERLMTKYMTSVQTLDRKLCGYGALAISDTKAIEDYLRSLREKKRFSVPRLPSLPSPAILKGTNTKHSDEIHHVYKIAAEAIRKLKWAMAGLEETIANSWRRCGTHKNENLEQIIKLELELLYMRKIALSTKLEDLYLTLLDCACGNRCQRHPNEEEHKGEGVNLQGLIDLRGI